MTGGELPDAPAPPAIDAAPLACPPSYALVTPLGTYRVIATNDVFAAHHADCNDDMPGATHLASLETAEEIGELSQALARTTPGQYYVGAAQKPNQATTTEGWYVFTGGALPAGTWGSSNDDNPGENNEENLLGLSTADMYHDVTGDVPYPAVCECDGRPIDPTVAGYIP
jgi:hypothetical protein